MERQDNTIRKYFLTTYLVRDIYPEWINSSQNSIRLQTTQLEMSIIFEQKFSKDNVRMSNKLMKGWSTLLNIRET